MATTRDGREALALVARLREAAAAAQTEEEAREITARIVRLTREFKRKHGIGLPPSLAQQAVELEPGYRIRPHITYLSDRLAQAVKDVENGENRRICVSLPPRSGKSTLITKYGPIWMLRQHPDWKIATASHDPTLVSSWAAADRKIIEGKPSLGIELDMSQRALSRWETVEGGGLFSVSWRGAFTGRGAKVLIIDDPIADFVEAHSPKVRQALWDWWLSVAYTRLEAPSLVIVVMTRWHEDDFIGRLLSQEYEGDPTEWEEIRIPAIAEEPSSDRPPDQLGRRPGEPLLSPLTDENETQALSRIFDTKAAVGTYTFSSMYQQRPAPAKGAIFDSGWWRYWTRYPERATADGRVVYLDPGTLTTGAWLDSWDAAFKETEGDGGWVVGQRWVRQDANRYLIAQVRGHWSFTRTIEMMKRWALTNDPNLSPCGNLVHERLIEERANGAAIIDTLREIISGLVPINPTISKEARARSVTPEIESGNVFLPHPSDPGNEWMQEFLSEMRNFPHDVADDQVDALTQGLSGLRRVGRAGISVPGARPGWQVPRDVGRTAAAAMSVPLRRVR
jgi:predicted phage terminase large subunit-like protein